MEILLLVVIIAVAASGLYVAATFNKRTKQHTDPLEDAVKDSSEQIKKTAEDLGQQLQTAAQDLGRQLQTITNGLRQDRELAERDRNEMHSRFDLTDSRILSLPSQLLPELEKIERLHEQIDALKDEFDRDLLQLDHRVAQLSESLAQQSIKITGIHRYIKRQERQTEGSPRMDSLVLAMLEAESQMDGKGWGKPPNLYALTEKSSLIAADHEPSGEVPDAQSGALIPVEQEPLPDGDLIEVLANIYWPEDVVGCVLVTELIALPPRGEEDAPIDPVAAEQWASTRPDGRPARLAVGVSRNGEHRCGFRVKGEDDVQVRTDVAGDLVTALLGTF